MSTSQQPIAIQPMSTQRLLNVYLAEAKYAWLRFLRTPAFVIPTLLFPTFFYLMIGFLFGAFKAKTTDLNIPLYMLCGFATMAAATPGMFGFGIGLATEREQGLLTLKRALPMPPMASLLGSVAMSMLSTLMATAIVMLSAIVLGVVSLTFAQVAGVLGVVTLGAIPFCSLGLLLGSLTSARAAPAIVNILYILLIYFSGLFIQLPKAISSVVVVSPAFYLHQLALAAAQTKNFMIVGPLLHVIVLASITLVCLGIASRRLARVG